MTSHLVYVEHIVEGKYIEYEYAIEVINWEPIVLAHVSGPPDECYPAEGGEVEWNDDTVKRRLTGETDGPWEVVPYSIFIEGFAQVFGSDPSKKWCGQTAVEKAEEQLQTDLYDACEEQARDSWEDAQAEKGEMRREARMLGED